MRGYAVAVALVLLGCAGTFVQRATPMSKPSESSRLLVFPFRDPSRGGKEFPGVGDRFSHEFATAGSVHGLNLIPVSSVEFKSSTDVDVARALRVAEQEGADFIVTGQITKWVDRATEWNGRRDFAGVSVTVREVPGGRVAASIEIEKHSNNFWGGTPDDFLLSLANEAASELFARGRPGQ